MTEPSIKELQADLQAYLNCLELCRAFEKQTSDPYVRESLNVLIDDLQESLAVLARHLRQAGIAPGARELDRRGRARVMEVLAMRPLREQLLAVRNELADLVARHDTYVLSDSTDAVTHELLESLSAGARRMLEGWDQHLHEMKAV